MRRTRKYQDPTEWHPYFALFPTTVWSGDFSSRTTVWLEWIECRMIPGHDGMLWHYRLPEKP